MQTVTKMGWIGLRGISIVLRGLICGAVFMECCLGPLSAQVPRKPPAVQKQKATDTSKSDPTAVNTYADAANFQNNGAFPLAVEEWRKLLKDYPKDPLASKASHYLGVCYMQLATPDYVAASQAFARALVDTKLDIRDESLINLGWCQFMQARADESSPAAQRKLYEQARETLTDYIKAYPQGAAIDQALFFSGEIEYSLGNTQKAINFYEQLIKAKSLTNSSWRPDAEYALGVAHEQLGSQDDARTIYEGFLKQYATHRLASKVNLRLADLLLRTGKPVEAEKILQAAAADASNSLADYAQLRLGQAFLEQQRLDEAAQAFMALVEKFPKSEYRQTARLSAGQTYLRVGQNSQAAEVLRESLSGRGDQGAEAAHLLAMTWQRSNQVDSAIEMLQDVLKWAGETPSALALQMDLADALSAKPEQIEAARLAYEKIATEHPDDPLAPRAAYNAAFVALQGGKLDDARRWAEIFLKKYPQDPLRADVAYVAAETMLQQGQHAAAAEAYGRLIENEKGNSALPYWITRLAMAHYLAGKYSDALQLLDSKLSVFQEPAQKAEAQSLMGSCYLFLNKPQEAVEQFLASQQTSDKWVRADEVLLMLSQAYQRQDDSANALKTLEKLTTQYPQSRQRFQAQYRIGQVRSLMKDYPGAITAYRTILDEPVAGNLHDYARYGIALSQVKQQEYAAALETLTPLLASQREDSLGKEAILAQALCQRKLGKLDEAIAELNQFIDTQPSGLLLANGLYELGMAQVETKQFDQAVDSFERILKQVPDYAAKDKILYELGWAYGDLEQPEKANAKFQELLDTFPESDFAPEAIYQVAQHHFQSKDYDKAKPLYISALNKANDKGLKEKAQYKLGWTLFQQAKYGEAAREFRRQAEQFPKGTLIVDAYFMSAECLFKQDQFPEALAGYQLAKQILAKNPDSDVSEQVRTLIYLHGAQCLREQKKWADCEAWLREIIARYPNSPYLPEVIYELAAATQSLGNSEEALRLYGEVATKFRSATAARARFMMGELYFTQRQFDKAIPEFQRVMFGYGADKADDDIKNWQARAGFEAGRCSEVLVGDLKGDARSKALSTAKEQYKYVIDKHPTHEMAKQAQIRLDELGKLP